MAFVTSSYLYKDLDKYHRVIGVDILTWTVTTLQGVSYHWYPRATRNGKGYGAVQTTRTCAAHEEREADIARYLVGSRKRASKNGVKP